jgi:hypothetical protein
MSISEITKTIITALGLVVSIGTMLLHTFGGFLPANIAAIISSVVGIATIVLNYAAPNTTSVKARAVGRSVAFKPKKPVVAK